MNAQEIAVSQVREYLDAWVPSGYLTHAHAALDAVADQIELTDKALNELVEAARSITRPGLVSGSVEEQVSNIRMTNAVDACALLIGHSPLLSRGDAA